MPTLGFFLFSNVQHLVNLSMQAQSMVDGGRSLQESFDRAKGVRHSGANEKVYSQTYLKVQNVLGIR